MIHICSGLITTINDKLRHEVAIPLGVHTLLQVHKSNKGNQFVEINR
jgi:hypothetical protein